MERVAIVLLSHRRQMLPSAVRSVLDQSEPVQLIVTHSQSGYATKFNEAAALARGDFIVPLCDDDRLHPRYVERCLYFGKDADIVFTDRAVWWSVWEWMNPRSWFHRTPSFGSVMTLFPQAAIAAMQAGVGHAARVTIPPDSFAFGSPLPMTCMIRRTLWNQLGGYDNIPHADTEFWYRAVKAGARVVYVPEPLFLYHMHGAQGSRLYTANGEAALAFHRKHFADFGFVFTPKPENPEEHDCTILAPEERGEYARRHGLRVVA